MKQKNFPARKLARQLGADYEMPARFILAGMPHPHPELFDARNVRSKKNRSGARP